MTITKTVVKLNGKYAVLTHGTHTQASGVAYTSDVYSATLFPDHAGVNHIRDVKGEVVRVNVTITEIT